MSSDILKVQSWKARSRGIAGHYIFDVSDVNQFSFNKVNYDFSSYCFFGVLWKTPVNSLGISLQFCLAMPQQSSPGCIPTMFQLHSLPFLASECFGKV